MVTGEEKIIHEEENVGSVLTLSCDAEADIMRSLFCDSYSGS